MRVSLNWLRELVAAPLDGATLVRHFNLMSAEVESYGRITSATGLSVGNVLTCDPHPDSDHLHVCNVDVGAETLQIVCGAPNVAAGQKVVVALDGAILPGDFRIRRSKIRGVASNGMICSLDELGIEHKYHQEDGIHVLSETAVPGSDPLRALGFDDEVIELDLTPNRGDLLSMMGVAFDVAAMVDAHPNIPVARLQEDKEKNTVQVATTTADCRSYYARVIRGVKVMESPAWLKARLIAAGVRPINNVVDVTNYIMLETGQPLHAFDYDKVGTARILVRPAGNDRTFVTLDGKERALLPDDLVITDGVRPIALAGVMGGKDTEIDGETKNILLESAVFDPLRIRKTSKRLDLRSEASIRFERGLDPVRTRLACDRAAELFQSLSGGRILAGVAVHESQNLSSSPVVLTLAKLIGVTGREFDAKTVANVWRRLGFEHAFKDGAFTVMVPTRRPDIRTYQDLIEEVVRISGYDLIPTKLHAAAFHGSLTEPQRFRRRLRHLLASFGLDEAVTYSLVDPAAAVAFDTTPAPTIRLLHPMSEDHSTLRHSLVPSLLDVVDYNLKRQVEDVRIFEIGKGYQGSTEPELVAGVVTGNCQESRWQGIVQPFDFYAVKGLLEALFGALSVKDLTWRRPHAAPALLHPGACAEVLSGDILLGLVGKLHPNAAAARNLPDCYLFELSFERMLQASKPNRTMEEIPRFPAVRRDIAILLDHGVDAAAVIATLRRAGGKTLASVEVFDVYEGERIASGRKSIALALTFLDRAKTLETLEIDRSVAKLVQKLEQEFGATLRV